MNNLSQKTAILILSLFGFFIVTDECRAHGVSSIIEDGRYDTGDTIKSYTAEGVGMTFRVINEEKKEVEVYGYLGKTSVWDNRNRKWQEVNSYIPAIAKATSGTVTIPEKVLDYTVTGISDDAFYDCNRMTTISIPQTVSTIGRSFPGCSNLNKVIISNLSVWVQIEAGFDYPYRLYLNDTEITSLVIPNDVENISRILDNCSSIVDVSIPSNIQTITQGAFSRCSNLINVFLNSNSIASQGDIIGKFSDYVENYVIGDSVTSIGPKAFQSTYNAKIKSVTISDSVRSIGDDAFRNCRSIASIRIPKQLESIGLNAFYGCSSLSKVIIQDITAWCKVELKNVSSNPLESAHHLFNISDEEIIDLKIPDGVKTIGNYVFCGGSALSSISFPGSLNNIGEDAFRGCYSLDKFIITDLASWCSTSIKIGATNFDHRLYDDGGTEITNLVIPEGVKTVNQHVFENCIGLSSVSFPNSTERIYNSFAGCPNLSSLILPDNVCESFIDKSIKIYVNEGTCTVLALWRAGVSPYKIGTEQEIPAPFLSTISSTQTTVTVKVENKYEAYVYYLDDIYGQQLEGESTVLRNLFPQTSRNITVKVFLPSKEDVYYLINSTVNTEPISPTVEKINATASSLYAKVSYLRGDAKVISTRLILNPASVNTTYGATGGTVIEDTVYYATGLDPGKSISLVCEVYIEGKDNPYVSSIANLVTQPLSITTSQPKVLSVGNVIVSAQSNLDDEEKNVGFEWRRTDWSDEFPSNTGNAYLYEGTIEGYIRNLNAEKLWRFRPYYLSDSGTYYYGDWMGLDPTNTSYFEPTVHTYTKIEVKGNTAFIKGYALRGSDRVAVQGFKYWKDTAGVRAKSSLVPNEAMTIEADGQVMTASLTNLDYESTYYYVAFVTTSEGETFYGEQLSFSTDADLSGIGNIVFGNLQPKIIARYNTSGHRISTPHRGLNILRMSDGTVKKVYVK